MAAGVEQNINVKIRAIVDGLNSVKELESAVKRLQASGSKRLGLDTSGASSNGIKLVTVLRQLSPAADRASSSAEEMGEAFGVKLSGSLLAAVGALGVAATLFTGAEVLLFKLAAAAAAAANRVGELSDQTGLSVENLSAVGTIAEQNSSSMEEYASSVGFLEKKISDAANGSKEAAADLKKLGIEPVRAVGDLDYAVGQAFKTINDYKGTAHAAGLATDAFGRSGKTLIPTITAVGGSIEEAKRQAAALGTLLTREAVQAAQKFDQAMDNLGLRVKGLAYSTGNQLVPAMTQLVTALDSLLGAAKPQLIFFFQALAGQVAYFANQIAVAAAAIEAFNGSGGSWSERFGAAYTKYVVAAASAPAVKNTASPGGGGGGKGGGAKSLKEREADLWREVMKSQGEDAAAVSGARASNVEDLLGRENKDIARQLDARLIAYRKYYAELERIETEAIDQEILRQQQALGKIDDELEQKRREIAADKKLTAGERVLKELAAGNEANAKGEPILQKITALERDRADVVARVAADAKKTTEEYERQVSAVNQELLRFQGQGAEADKLGIDERFRELRERAAANGDQAAVALIDALKRRLKRQGQFDDVVGRIEEVFQNIRDAEAAIDAEASVGNITAEDAERRKLDAQRAQVSTLKELHGELRGVAEATKDPALLAAVNRMGIEIELVGKHVNETARLINDELKAGLEDTFADIITGSKSAKEAFADLARHMLSLIAQILAQKFVEKLFGNFLTTKADGGGGFSFGSLITGFLGFSEGGHVEGPGSETSDSIVARLSKNEYVVKAASVRKLGTRVLDHINSFGELPGFAAGGLVGELPTVKAAGGNVINVRAEFHGVTDAQSFRENEQAINRKIAQAAQRGLRRAASQPKG